MGLRINNYSKRFGDKLILSVPSIYLPPDIYWVKGENGSGKTTLLQSIAGLIPFDGEISVAAISLRTQPSDYKKIVNYAEAEPFYPDFLTGDDLISFYLSAKKGTNEQVMQLVNSFGIAAYKSAKIATYSSGMVKKLSLMLAFIGLPKLILLDEPLITLDVSAVAKLQELIKIYRDRGVGFLITSHQEVEIPEYAMSRIFVANNTISL